MGVYGDYIAAARASGNPQQFVQQYVSPAEQSAAIGHAMIGAKPTQKTGSAGYQYNVAPANSDLVGKNFSNNAQVNTESDYYKAGKLFGNKAAYDAAKKKQEEDDARRQEDLRKGNETYFLQAALGNRTANSLREQQGYHDKDYAKQAAAEKANAFETIRQAQGRGVALTNNLKAQQREAEFAAEDEMAANPAPPTVSRPAPYADVTPTIDFNNPANRSIFANVPSPQNQTSEDPYTQRLNSDMQGGHSIEEIMQREYLDNRGQITPYYQFLQQILQQQQAQQTSRQELNDAYAQYRDRQAAANSAYWNIR